MFNNWNVYCCPSNEISGQLVDAQEAKSYITTLLSKTIYLDYLSAEIGIAVLQSLTTRILSKYTINIFNNFFFKYMPFLSRSPIYTYPQQKGIALHSHQIQFIYIEK